MKKLFLCVIVLLLNIITQAQTSTIKLMDLTVMPMMTDTTSVSSDSVNMVILFKINTPSLADKVHLWFGSAQDQGDISLQTGQFQLQGSQYYILFSGSLTEMAGYDARLYCKLSNSQFSNMHYLTLFVEDNAQQSSNRIYFNK